MSSPAFVTCLQHHIPRTQQNQAFPVTQTIIISQENYNLKRSQTSETASLWGFSLPLNLGEMSRNVVKLIRFATKISKNIGKR